MTFARHNQIRLLFMSGIMAGAPTCQDTAKQIQETQPKEIN